MNDLLLRVLSLLILVFGGVMQGNAEERIKMGFRLPSYPQKDRDLGIIQNFLFFHTFSEVQKNKKEGYSFTSDIEGQLFIEGDQEKLNILAFSLGMEMEKLIKEEISCDAFFNSKRRYLSSLEESGALFEKELAQEIKWEDLEEVKGSLHPIEMMLKCVSPSLAEKVQLEFQEAPLELVLVHDAPNYQLFYQLPLNGDEQQNITKLIKKMADSGYWELLKKKGELDKLGDKIMPVHPLRFIGFVYSNPCLKKRMPKIMNATLKRRGFLNGHGSKEGFSQRMTKEAHNHNLMQYLPGFAQSIGVTQSLVEPYFHRHDWEGLLRFLM